MDSRKRQNYYWIEFETMHFLNVSSLSLGIETCLAGRFVSWCVIAREIKFLHISRLTLVLDVGRHSYFLRTHRSLRHQGTLVEHRHWFRSNENTTVGRALATQKLLVFAEEFLKASLFGVPLPYLYEGQVLETRAKNFLSRSQEQNELHGQCVATICAEENCEGLLEKQQFSGKEGILI